jgi:clan AA aspartic protease (TIGR02281 family)
LDNIRNTEEFKALIQQYDNRASFSALPKQDATYIEKTTVVKLKKSGGIYEMPCEINGLKLNLFFDSGASDVTISSTEAGFMLKNNYLSSKDIIGTTSYMIADGSIAEGTVINLREVKVGDFTLKNVKASVVHNQNAPLLLGQTVLKRFANITIDNEKMELVIKYKDAK